MVDALSWLSSALAATATYNVTLRAPAPEPTHAASMEVPNHDAWELQPGGHNDLMAMHQAAHAQPQARGLAGGSNLATRYNKCLDVPSGRFTALARPQLWDCAQGSDNQAWKIVGNLLQTNNNMCLDVPDGRAFFGAPVQLYPCDKNNRNQWFEAVGNSIRKKNTNWCLDVADGRYENAARLQLWACDYNNQGNMRWNFNSAQVGQQTFQSPSSFMGYAMVTWDRFCQLHPELNPWKADFQNAAAANGLHPSLLGAIAAVESSFREKPSSNSWGMFQFSDDGAWRQFGNGGNRQNARDAVWAAARYIRYLLDNNNQNLDSALRAYNGPLSQGGNPGYQNEIRTWASGGSTW